MNPTAMTYAIAGLPFINMTFNARVSSEVVFQPNCLSIAALDNGSIINYFYLTHGQFLFLLPVIGPRLVLVTPRGLFNIGVIDC